MKAVLKTIPYCGNCSRKIRKEGMAKGEFYCDVVSDTRLNGVVTLDMDGSYCMELGVYKPIQKTTYNEKKTGASTIIGE